MSLSVVFMGTPEFAVASLRRILHSGHSVPLVVTAPDRPRGRGLKVQSSAVHRYAVERGLPVAMPDSLKDPEFLERVRALSPDVICVVAFRILPEELFSIPSRGSFNLHGSLLPRYRGAAPIQRAIMAGETATGVTTFFLRPRVDTGAILMQRDIPIGPDMTAGQLHDIMMEAGAELVVETLARIERGDADPTPQNEAEATPAPKIFREDCVINWAWPAKRIHDHIRGLSPWPGAFTHLGGRVLKLYRSRLLDACDLMPGMVRIADGGIHVGTGAGNLEITELQIEGGRTMSAAEFLRGRPIDNGFVLDNQ